jgi:putative ABC transport system permease protein
VTTQYFIAALLISGILLVYNQVDFIKHRETGFQRENLLNIKVPSDTSVSYHLDVFMNDIKTSSKVLWASPAMLNLAGVGDSFTPLLQNEDGSQFQMGSNSMRVGEDFLPTIGAEVIIGRNFNKNIVTDGDESILINEAAAKKFGWKDPLKCKFLGWTPQERLTMNVVGVVKDFHLGVSYQEVPPTIIFVGWGSWRNLYVRVTGDNLKETLAMIEATWAKDFPGNKIDLSFVDQDLEQLYAREENFLSLLAAFCVVIIFIATLGIVGLISYTTRQRKKEIAIRKVLGSTFSNTVAILSRKFVFLVIIANVLAIPATWYVIQLWLSNFAFRVAISPFAFVIPFAICLGFTGLSIAWHTTRAALANPVEALKCE